MSRLMTLKQAENKRSWHFKSRYPKRFESSLEASHCVRRALAKTFESYILDGRY